MGINVVQKQVENDIFGSGTNEIFICMLSYSICIVYTSNIFPFEYIGDVETSSRSIRVFNWPMLISRPVVLN